jgi:hypothetical protein
MKTLRSLPFLAVVLAAGCAPDQQSLIITNLFPPASDNCFTGSKPTIAQTRGSMNTGLTRAYDMIFAVDSLFVDNDLVPNGNIAVMTEIDYAYSTSPGPTGSNVGLPASETRSLHFEVSPASKDNLILENLIGPQMSLALDAVPAGNSGDYFVLHVQASFKGTLVSGGAVQTNRISFPISVYNTGAGGECFNGAIIDASKAPCGNVGQDVQCCAPDAMDPTKCAQ